jgi:hypothetical protein
MADGQAARRCEMRMDFGGPLHITAEMPLRANQVRENKMAKKLKKAKKIEPTKPLMKR